MNLSQADRAISAHLAANWVETPVVWPNVEPRDFSLPGQPLLPTGTADHIAVRTRGSGGFPIAVGCESDRYTGQLFLAACVREGTGVRIAKERLDRLIPLFRGSNATLRDTTGVVRFIGLSGPVGYPTDNGWYVEEASLIYQFEHTY